MSQGPASGPLPGLEACPEQSLSIVMAAFNEEEALGRCAARTLDFLRDHVASGELIIVDDGSTDKTGALVEELAERWPSVRAVHLERNRGMGAALLRGFAEARRDWVSILPADGQIDAYDLLELFAVAEGADLVTTLYRNRRYSPGRWVLSKGLRVMTILIVGTRARSDGTYLIRRRVLEALGPRSQSFLLNQEIPIRARRGGYRVKTVSTDVHERIAGQSKAATVGRILATFLEHFSLRAALEREQLERFLGGLIRRRGRR